MFKVGHCGLEPQTSVLSERRYKTPLVEILRHLAAIGQISQGLLSSLQQDDEDQALGGNGHRPEKARELIEYLKHQG